MNVKKVMSLMVAISMATALFAAENSPTRSWACKKKEVPSVRINNLKEIAARTAVAMQNGVAETMAAIAAQTKIAKQQQAMQSGDANGSPDGSIAGKGTGVVTDPITNTDDTFGVMGENKDGSKKLGEGDLKDPAEAQKEKGAPSEVQAVAEDTLRAGARTAGAGVKAVQDLVNAAKSIVNGAKGLSLEALSQSAAE